MSDMCSFEHMKMLNRVLTTAFATLGTNVSWADVKIKLPLKGKNIDYNRSYFNFTNIYGTMYMPSMGDNEMDDPYAYVDDFICDAMMDGSTKFVNETFKTLGMKDEYGKADINEDLIYSEVIDAIRRAPDSQPSPIMKGYMIKAARDSMYAKAQNMAGVIKGLGVPNIDKALLAVAINNAKILALMPEELMSTGELMEIFDKSIFTVLGNTQVRDIFMTQALNSNVEGGGVVFTDEKLVEAFRVLMDKYNIQGKENHIEFGPSDDDYDYDIDGYDIDNT